MTAGTAHSAEGVAEHWPRLQWGSVGSVQGRCRPPILVHTSLVEQSTQVEPIAVHGLHWGYQGAEASHGGIQGLTPPAPGGPAPGTAAATATCKNHKCY